MKVFYTLSCLVIFSLSTAAQDVVIVGSDGDGGDEFAFVLLRDFAGGETLFFTEDEYVDGTGDFVTPPGEAHILYTIPAGGLLEGDVITITESSANAFTVGGGGGTATYVAGSGNWGISFQDEVYAYSATNATSPWNSVTTVHCFYWTAVVDPLATQVIFNDFPNGIYLEPNNHPGNPGNQNVDFKTGTFRVNTTLADLQDIANWNRTVGNITLSTEDFTNQMIASSSLPVEIIAFDAHQKDKMVHLSWSTSSELDNDRFEVEHSSDGLSFQTIGKMTGAGTSFTTQTYFLQHETPIAGLNYYRLKQVDVDGQYAFSKVVTVNFTTKTGFVGEFYPNPSSDGTVQLDYSSLEERQVQFLVHDLSGQLIRSYDKNLTKGENLIDFDFSTLVKGLYIIQIGDDIAPIFRRLTLN